MSKHSCKNEIETATVKGVFGTIGTALVMAIIYVIICWVGGINDRASTLRYCVSDSYHFQQFSNCLSRRLK